MRKIILAVFLCIFTVNGVAWAQCDQEERWGEWLSCLQKEAIKTQISQKGNANQVESSSLGGNSDSLVDQSSAPDFIGLALNMAGLKSNSDEMEATAFSITTSAYALLATAKKQDPLNPTFYNQHSAWRKLSFLFGSEFPDEEGAASNQRATLFGVKYLLTNRRDATHSSYDQCGKYEDKNSDGIPDIDDENNKICKKGMEGWGEFEVANTEAAVETKKLSDAITNYLVEKFMPPDGNRQDFLTSIRTDKDEFNNIKEGLKDRGLMNEIDEIVNRHIAVETKFLSINQNLINRIRNAPQVSLSYQSKLRKEDGTDEYRLQFIIDKGFPGIPNLNLSANASFDYMDSKMPGGDMRGGRFAVEGKYQLYDTTLTEKKEPVTFSFASEGKWMAGTAPIYKSQVKLTIPLVNGISLPISATWANRTEMVNKEDVQARIGFSFDLAKLAAGFKAMAPTN